jgi:hypothetical protein
MPPYALYEFVQGMWIVARNHDGAEFIRIIKVSNN